jgi:DNA-binding transcriptional regulator YiaG
VTRASSSRTSTPARADAGSQPDVFAIRQRHCSPWFPISQKEFAALYGFSYGAVRDWEQKRRKPSANSRALLSEIARDPVAALKRLGRSLPDLKVDGELLSPSPATPRAKTSLELEDERALARLRARQKVPQYLLPSPACARARFGVPAREPDFAARCARARSRVPKPVICGAQNRRGTPCRRTDIHPNGRCKYHGGLSTGPKTTAGREAALANLRMRWSSRVTGLPN